jgi:hypothetical protein
MMSIGKVDLGEFTEAELEDAWYELEGAYEVYGIGRCRFVLVHCRAAMLIGLVLLAKKKGTDISEGRIESLGEKLGIPERLTRSCLDIDQAGSYGNILEKEPEDQERAATMLSKTLEVFEWIRSEIAE